MGKIEAIAEQTKFLLEKQKEVLEFFKKEFESVYSLLSAEQESAEKVNAGAELQSFQSVRTMLSDHEKEIMKQFDEDVKFLEEQLGAITKISQMEDQKQAEELTEMMLEDGEELSDTNQFKADVEQESEEAKQSFSTVVSDIKTTLSEEGIKELEALLQAHIEAAKQENDDECDESSCSSCPGCNIFEGLEEESEKSSEDDAKAEEVEEKVEQ